MGNVQTSCCLCTRDDHASLKADRSSEESEVANWFIERSRRLSPKSRRAAGDFRALPRESWAAIHAAFPVAMVTKAVDVPIEVQASLAGPAEAVDALAEDQTSMGSPAGTDDVPAQEQSSVGSPAETDDAPIEEQWSKGSPATAEDVPAEEQSTVAAKAEDMPAEEQSPVAAKAEDVPAEEQWTVGSPAKSEDAPIAEEWSKGSPAKAEDVRAQEYELIESPAKAEDVPCEDQAAKGSLAEADDVEAEDAPTKVVPFRDYYVANFPGAVPHAFYTKFGRCDTAIAVPAEEQSVAAKAEDVPVEEQLSVAAEAEAAEEHSSVVAKAEDAPAEEQSTVTAKAEEVPAEEQLSVAAKAEDVPAEEQSTVAANAEDAPAEEQLSVAAHAEDVPAEDWSKGIPSKAEELATDEQAEDAPTEGPTSCLGVTEADLLLGDAPFREYYVAHFPRAVPAAFYTKFGHSSTAANTCAAADLAVLPAAEIAAHESKAFPRLLTGAREREIEGSEDLACLQKRDGCQEGAAVKSEATPQVA